MSRFTKMFAKKSSKTETSVARASRRILTVLAAAITLSLAAPVFAAEPAPAQTDTRTTAQPPAGSHIIRHDTKVTDLGVVNVTPMGAVRDSGHASWTDDDTSAPELPMVHDQGTAPR